MMSLVIHHPFCVHDHVHMLQGYVTFTRTGKDNLLQPVSCVNNAGVAWVGSGSGGTTGSAGQQGGR